MAVVREERTPPLARLRPRRAGDDRRCAVEIGGRHDGSDAVQLPGRCAVHAEHARVCVRAPDERDVEHARQAYVVEEPCPAAQERGILDAWNALPDVPEGPAHACSSRSSWAASRTAATIAP